jgi:hypothetical protein
VTKTYGNKSLAGANQSIIFSTRRGTRITTHTQRECTSVPTVAGISQPLTKPTYKQPNAAGRKPCQWVGAFRPRRHGAACITAAKRDVDAAHARDVDPDARGRGWCGCCQKRTAAVKALLLLPWVRSQRFGGKGRSTRACTYQGCHRPGPGERHPCRRPGPGERRPCHRPGSEEGSCMAEAGGTEARVQGSWALEAPAARIQG